MGNAKSRIDGYVRALALGVLVALVLIQPASATPLMAGESAIFNFDSSGSNPPPPYQQIATQIDMDRFVVGAGVTYEWFTELNGGGRMAFAFSTFEGFHVIIGGLTAPDLVDGIYSFKVIALADLDIASLEGYFANTGDEFYTLGATGTLAVPEPASLALFITGLLGLGVMRRRQNI